MPIDDFFREFNQRLQSDEIDERELLGFILSREIPSHAVRKKDKRDKSLLGFVMEAHAKKIVQGMEETYPVSTSRFVSGEFRYAPDSAEPISVYYETSPWGNVFFYRHFAGRSGEISRITEAEIDALYEWKGARGVIPIVVEVTRTAGNRNLPLKLPFVEKLFGNAPYFCKIRLARPDEQRGLFSYVAEIDGSKYHYRRLLINNEEMYERISQDLRDVLLPA